jgi:3-hydroxybutyryl-CoA dehydratase
LCGTCKGEIKLPLKVGDIINFERTFTVEDVKLFTNVSGDEGSHHITPDEQGRHVIKGLLIATLPTKLEGSTTYLLVQ